MVVSKKPIKHLTYTQTIELVHLRLNRVRKNIPTEIIIIIWLLLWTYEPVLTSSLDVVADVVSCCIEVVAAVVAVAAVVTRPVVPVLERAVVPVVAPAVVPVQ